MSLLGRNDLLGRAPRLFQEDTWEKGSLKEDSYELRLGRSELLVAGEYFPAFTKGLVDLPPHQVCFLSSEEVIHMPPGLSGRVVLTFEFARKGLLMLFGGHVAPGYHGRMFLVVYNLSDQPIPIRLLDPFARIQFHEVTGADRDGPAADATAPTLRLPRDIVHDWQARKMPRVFEELGQHGQRLDRLEQDVKTLGMTSQYAIWGGVILIAVTILAAVLQTAFGAWSATGTFGGTADPEWTPLVPIATVLLFAALLAVLVVLAGSRIAPRGKPKDAPARRWKPHRHRSGRRP